MVKKEKETVFRPQVGDKIVCEHNGNKYEAKVLEVRKNPAQEKNPDFQYKVHYKGWNKNWDEWVDCQRVFEANELSKTTVTENKQTKVNKATGSTRKKPAVQASQLNSSTASIKSTSSEAEIAEPEPIEPSKEIKIKIPDELKNWLIDDDNNIKNKKLTALPAKTVIATILKDFVNYKKSTAKALLDKEAVLNELTSGIKDYFNVMLGSFLLYKFERLQYQLLLKEHGKEVDLTAHYGAIHLVRLSTRIGKLLASSSLDSQNIHTIVTYIQDLMKFVSKQPQLFDPERIYTVAPPEYIKNALK